MSISVIKDATGGDLAHVDSWNNALVTMDEIHANVHRGIMFEASHANASVANNGDVEVIVQVHADQAAHMRWFAAAGGDMQIEVYEGVTYSSAGTSILTPNLNRFSSNTATALVSHTPTLTDDGTLLASSILPGGTAGRQPPIEWILKTGEDYLFRLTNIDGGNQAVSLALDWYEPA